jgi:hypothetical protein
VKFYSHPARVANSFQDFLASLHKNFGHSDTATVEEVNTILAPIFDKNSRGKKPKTEA